MILTDLIQQVPDLTEEKLIESVEELLKSPLIQNFKIFKIKNWTAKELIDEWDLIRFKQSKLSRNQRDSICLIVEYALIKLIKNDGDKV